MTRKVKKLIHKEQVERDAMALAQLLLDIYKKKKHKEQNDADTSK